MVNFPPPSIPIERITHVVIKHDIKRQYQRTIRHAVALGFQHYYDLPNNIRWELLRFLVSTQQSFGFSAYIEQSLVEENEINKERNHVSS
jgi:hypothetical protein